MVFVPSSKVSFAKKTLGYPLFAADFDPYNRGYLVVGGGGGESKTGVPNQITVLDVLDRSNITTAAEIDLSREEDSVQCVANLATKDGLITFAGINSSSADQNAGKNEHLRSFDIKYPPRKKQKTEKSAEDEQGEVKPIGKRSLFKASQAAKKETYQRVLRLSPAQRRESGSKRIGAIATGLAKDSELIVFNATNPTPEDADIISRIDLDSEVADIDIIEPEECQFSIAYCTDFDLYEQTIKYDFGSKKAEKTPKGPRRIHQTPFPDPVQGPKSRPKFRAVRYLDSENLICLVNKADKSGAELRMFHLYPTGPATLVLQKTLPTHIRQAVSMDVCALDRDANGNQQVVAAVAAQDISIEVFVTNYKATTATYSPFTPYLTLRDVHEHQMTKICFSPFHSPTRAPDADSPATGSKGQPAKTAAPDHPGPQYIRLASVTYGNSVVVDTFPLSPLDPKDKHSRYVLSHPSDERFTQWAYIALISLIVVIAAFLIQAFVTSHAEGNSVGPFSLRSRDVRDFVGKPASAAMDMGERVRVDLSSAVEDALPSNMPGKGRLRELLSTHRASTGTKALVVRDAGDSTSLSVDVHPDKEAYVKEDTNAKRWEDLDEQQKASWKTKLVQAGEWAESEGESVLMGVMFSEYAGMIGGLVGQALAG